MKKAIIFALPLLLTACGTFPLSGGTYPPPGKSGDQARLDNLECSQRAQLEINSSAQQTQSFLLGLTIIGTPLAYELERRKGREVFAACMTDRGYRVLPVPEEKSRGV